jgi:hypothetical protein
LTKDKESKKAEERRTLLEAAVGMSLERRRGGEEERRRGGEEERRS